MKARLTVRLIGPTVAIGLTVLAVGAIAAWYTHRLQRDASDIIALNVGSMRAAEELEICLREVRTKLAQFLLTSELEHLEAIPKLRKEADRWMEQAERLATTPREGQWMARARAGYDHLFREIDDLLASPNAGDQGKRVKKLADVTLSREILPPVHEYLDFNEEVMGTAGASTQKLADRMALVFLLLGGCGAVAGVVLGFGISRAVQRSLGQLSIPVRDAAGKLNEVVGPITLSANWDLIELEAALHRVADQVGAVVGQLQQSQREVLRADQLAAVGQLAAGMAHEIRNPLTAMKVLVEAEAENGSAACLRGRDVAVLQEEIGRVEKLVQVFLDFARPPEPHKQVVELKELVQQTVDLVGRRAEQQGVTIHCIIPNEGARIEADRGQLRQVTLNLLLNALDATREGGTVSVEVTLPVKEKTRTPTLTGGAPITNPHWLTLQVSDTGSGLPITLGQQIFDPFVSTKVTGLGLGLSICKRIVDAHGGVITAIDRPGGGAIFRVNLPPHDQALAPACSNC